MKKLISKNYSEYIKSVAKFLVTTLHCRLVSHVLLGLFMKPNMLSYQYNNDDMTEAHVSYYTFLIKMKMKIRKKLSQCRNKKCRTAVKKKDNIDFLITFD